MLCLCCCLYLSLMMPVLPPSSHWTLHWGHHAYLPGACEPRSLPQSALSGCRLSAMGLCSHKLNFSPPQAPSGRLWSSRLPMHGSDHSAGLKLQLHACLENATRLICLKCAPCPQSHFLHPASASFTICAPSQQGAHTPSNNSQALIPLSSTLLRHPGTGNPQIPRSSYLDFVLLRHHPLMGRAHYRPDGTRRRTRGELEARAKKKAQRAQEEAQVAAAAPLEEAEHGAGAGDVWPEGPADAEEEEVEIEVEMEEAAEASPVHHRPCRTTCSRKAQGAGARLSLSLPSPYGTEC